MLLLHSLIYGLSSLLRPSNLSAFSTSEYSLLSLAALGLCLLQISSRYLLSPHTCVLKRTQFPPRRSKVKYNTLYQKHASSRLRLSFLRPMPIPCLLQALHYFPELTKTNGMQFLPSRASQYKVGEVHVKRWLQQCEEHLTLETLGIHLKIRWCQRRLPTAGHAWNES